MNVQAKKTLGILAVIISAFIILGVIVFSLVQKLILKDEEFLSEASFLPRIARIENKSVLLVRYTGKIPSSGAPFSIEGEKLIIIANYLDGSAEEFTFENKIDAFDELSLPVRDDLIFYDIYYNGKRII